MNVPFDIKLMYFVQCGFYLHSIYATLYMDYKRKDFYAMLIHHVLTMTLIFVSYATRLDRFSKGDLFYLIHLFL
jgi:ceramide synthetase